MTNTNRPEFAAQLITLGQHLTEHPDLPQIYSVTERLDGGFAVRLMSDQGEPALIAWAATLSAPTSYARRFHEEHVDGNVLSRLGGHVFEVVGRLPDDAVPPEPGHHEWTVTR